MPVHPVVAQIHALDLVGYRIAHQPAGQRGVGGAEDAYVAAPRLLRKPFVERDAVGPLVHVGREEALRPAFAAAVLLDVAYAVAGILPGDAHIVTLSPHVRGARDHHGEGALPFREIDSREQPDSVFARRHHLLEIDIFVADPRRQVVEHSLLRRSGCRGGAQRGACGKKLPVDSHVCNISIILKKIAVFAYIGHTRYVQPWKKSVWVWSAPTS